MENSICLDGVEIAKDIKRPEPGDRPGTGEVGL